MSSQPPWQPRTYPDVARLSQADAAYRNLRRVIVMWQVEPGSWLSESELQELSGFARTPTREAAGRLIADGLLVGVPRNGYQVTDVSPADAADLYDLWESLAPITGRLAAGRMDDATLRSLRETVTRPATAGDVEALVALSETVFDAVLQATGNRWLRRVGLGLSNHLLRLWVLVYRAGPPSSATEGFSHMLTALETDDSSAGEEAFVAFTAVTRAATLAAVVEFAQHRAARGALGLSSRGLSG